jgi:hypothetical protein
MEPDQMTDDRREDGALADQLALMARSGLMTHVVELAPPVTAETVARFRARAAAQAGNVMAVGAGRFALCLPRGARALELDMPHRIWPIGADGRAPDRTPRDKGPKPLPAPTPGDAAGAPEAMDAASAPEAMVAALAEGQVALAGRIDALGGAIAAAAERLSEGRAASQGAEALDSLADRVAARLAARQGDADARLEAHLAEVAERLAAQQEQTAARLAAQQERAAGRLGGQIDIAQSAQAEALSEMMLRLDGLDARLDGLAADRPARAAPSEARIAALEEALHGHAAETGEALATLRLGLRAVNDRLDALPARLRDGAAGEATEPTPSRSATITPLPVPGRGASAETAALTRGLSDLVARLDALLDGAPPRGGEDTAAPLWRRSLHDRPGGG